MQSTLKSAQEETLEEEQRVGPVFRLQTIPGADVFSHLQKFLDLSEKVHQMHRPPDAGDEQSLASAPVPADPVYTNPF